MAEKIDIFHILVQLEPELIKLSEGSLAHESKYLSVLRASLIKNFEYSFFIWTPDQEKHSFFSSAVLRGICEEIIVLNFIKTLDCDEDREIFVKNLFSLNLLEACKAQSEFLENSMQPVVKFPNTDERINEARNKLKELSDKYSWTPRYNKLPSIKEMAEGSGLKEFYDFVYAATSRWVHFNPSVLMRMGWGDNPNNSYKASTSNFYKYYLDFNRFYSLYLFIKFYDLFNSEFPFSEGLGEQIELFRNHLNSTLRWPEIVTFEELNIKPPSLVLYALMRVTYEMKDEEEE